MREPVRWTEGELMVLAARGLGRIEAMGERGLTLVSKDEIAAMAGLLAVLGLVPISPGAAASRVPFVQTQTGA